MAEQRGVKVRRIGNRFRWIASAGQPSAMAAYFAQHRHDQTFIAAAK
jgi:hypothetical protein